MQLTRLRLDPRSAQARRDLADPYDMHRTLVRAFVDSETQAPTRFLWRLEPENLWVAPTVLVQSAFTADWSFLQSLPSYLKQDAETKLVDVLSLLQVNTRYRFRLVANPTVTRGGKRYGLVLEDAQLVWLQRQGERFGFKLETALVTASDLLQSRKVEHRISLRRVRFEGVLMAADVSALSRALDAGIGHGKALGCGLLSLARL